MLCRTREELGQNRYQGDVKQQDFLAFYIKDYRILAVAGMNRDKEMAVWEELIRNNRVPSPDRLSGDPDNILEKFKSFTGLF
ncbi:MAG TPA: oxidoreductase C-terminal domain-containing protein [Pyrinomonadaceae bacterium]|nr:oxidoreductase C-terminal domain-containing protein [Pyrinomonadaceae bacterium]